MVLPFFNHKSVETLTKVDIHSHLIPNIDDGAKDIEDSIALIKELTLLGYEKLITTPHISDMFCNTKEQILKGYHILKEELLRRGIDVEIEVAAEYYVDDHFETLLEKEELLTFGEEKYLLIEFSYFTPPYDLENLIYDILLKGYKPVLAHPERYLYWHQNFKKYRELKEEMGVLFQVNINSLNRYSNEMVYQTAESFIRKGMVDFVGSDTHHMKHIKNLKRSFNESLYKKIFQQNSILNDSLTT